MVELKGPLIKLPMILIKNRGSEGNEGWRDRSNKIPELSQALQGTHEKKKTTTSFSHQKEMKAAPHVSRLPQVIRIIVKFVCLIQHLKTFFRINLINLNPNC